MKELQFPLVRITAFFVFGIFFARHFQANATLVISLILTSLCVLIFLYFRFKKKLLQNSYFGITTFITAFLVGLFTLIAHNQTYNSKHYLNQLSSDEREVSVELIIKEKLKNTTSNQRYVCSVTRLNEQKSYGKIILNIRKENAVEPLPIGTCLKARGSIYKNRKPNNPNQFDYGNYLENQQLFGQLFVNPETLKIGLNANKNLAYYADRLRTKIIKNLEKNGFNKTELSVIVALILGQQQDIAPEVVRDYQYAGAVHVLSVSGLHVGFILLFVSFLLKPFPNTRKASIIKLIVIIFSLWAFGILAGLAPSVVRSVTMFSFVAIGMFLRRSVNIYNTLLVSILLILLFQPSFLFDVGFQLSYLALFFIVWFQPFLAAVWVPKYKIVSYFWDIITVSFAAQIGTFPISIYYFHQFPGLFFITNLIILPGMSIILGLGVVLMLLAAADWVWLPLMRLVEWSIWLLNKIIAWVASFESLVFRDVPLNFYMLWSCYFVIFSLIIWLKKPTYNKLRFGLLSIIILQITIMEVRYSSQKETEFIVFNKKRTTIITERLGHSITLFSNDSILKTANDNLVLKPYLVGNFCRIQKKKNLQNVYFFKNKKIMVLDSSSTYLKNQKPDVLILTQSPKINLKRLFKFWKPKQVVADASNYKSYVRFWKATCIEEKIPFHDTTEKGFFKL